MGGGYNAPYYKLYRPKQWIIGYPPEPIKTTWDFYQPAPIQRELYALGVDDFSYFGAGGGDDRTKVESNRLSNMELLLISLGVGALAYYILFTV